MILSGTYGTSDNPNVHVSSFTQPKLTLAMANLVTEVAQVNCSLRAKTHPDSANLGSQLAKTWFWLGPTRCNGSGAHAIASLLHPCFFSNRWVLGNYFLYGEKKL